MRTAKYQRYLSPPPEAVSNFLSRLCNDGLWRDEVLKTELISGSAGKAGSVYRETLTWEGLRAPTTLHVKDVSPTSLVVIALDPGYEATYEYSFRPWDEGTDLKLEVTVKTSAALLFVEPFLWAMVTRWFERGLDRLQTALRGQPRGPC